MSRLRFDPWTADYDGAWAVDTAAEPTGPVDLTVELDPADWQPLTAQTAAGRDELVFIDGSRRMDARVQLETDEGTFRAHGGLGTTAVGAVAVTSGERARFLPGLQVARWCFIGSAQQQAGVTLHAEGGYRTDLHFEAVRVTDTDPDAILQALQNRMRSEEAHLARNLAAAAPGALIVCDGPLPLEVLPERMIGYIKTTSIQRLPAEQLEVARRLKAGERTPVYLTGEGNRRNFEWLLRLRDPAPWFYSLAGTVRLQVRAGPQDSVLSDFVRSIADWSCAQLPRFSSQAHQDPRAPQQLLPVRALEAELRRRMGDPLLLRRRIVRDYFAA